MVPHTHESAPDCISIQDCDEEHDEGFVAHNWPAARRTFSPLGRYIEDRERVLGRGSRSWLAGRLLRSCDGDAQAAAAAVAVEARR